MKGCNPTRLPPLRMPLASGVSRQPTLLHSQLRVGGAPVMALSFENSLEWPIDPRKTLCLLLQFTIKDTNEQPNEQPEEEVRRPRSGRVQSRGAPVPGQLGCDTLQASGYIHQPGNSLKTPQIFCNPISRPPLLPGSLGWGWGWSWTGGSLVFLGLAPILKLSRGLP